MRFSLTAALWVKKPSGHLQSLVGERSAQPLTLTAKKHYNRSCVLHGIGQGVSRIEIYRFLGNNQDVLCGLADLIMEAQ